MPLLIKDANTKTRVTNFYFTSEIREELGKTRLLKLFTGDSIF